MKSDNTIQAMVTTGVNAQPLEGWSGCVFNGVAVMNNGFDEPFYTNTDTTMQSFDVESSLHWTSGVTCGTIRAFKNYLIALKYNGGGSTVKWSGPAAAGALPSWQESSSNTAGTNVLSDTAGEIVDGVALGNSFIIYKEDSVWAMEFIGGTFVFSFRKLFNDNEGALSKDCVVAFEGKHFVLGRNDAYIHDGTQKKSVMHNRVASELYKTLDDTNWSKIKVVADTANQNIWVYYPTQNNTWANKALIYNWATDSWSVREILSNVSYIATGIIEDDLTDNWNLYEGTCTSTASSTEMTDNTQSFPLSSLVGKYIQNLTDGSSGLITANTADTVTATLAGGTSNSWTIGDLYDIVDVASTWDEDTSYWDENNTQYEKESLLLCDYTNSKFLEAEVGITWDGTSYTTRVEKVGVDFGDATQWKKINAIYPSMTGEGTVNFYIGHQDPQGSAVTYEGPFSYTVDQDYKINCRVHGRNISFKMESTDDKLWAFDGMTIEYKPTMTKR